VKVIAESKLQTFYRPLHQDPQFPHCWLGDRKGILHWQPPGRSWPNLEWSQQYRLVKQ